MWRGRTYKAGVTFDPVWRCKRRGGFQRSELRICEKVMAFGPASYADPVPGWLAMVPEHGLR